MTNTPAGFWIRALASIIDHLILLVPHTLFWSILATSRDLTSLVHNLLIYIVIFIFPAFEIIYSTLTTYYFGGTPGKLLCGLRVVNSHNQPLGFKKLLFRHSIGYQLSSAIFGLGYLAVLRHPHKLAWHDQAVESQVVRTSYPFILSILASVILILSNGYYISEAGQNFAVNASLKFDIYHLYEDYQKQQSGSTTPQDRHSQALEYTQKAQQSYDSGDYQESLQQLQSAVGLDSQNGQTYHQLGQTLLKLGENDRASEAFQMAVELQPQNQVFKSSLESVK